MTAALSCFAGNVDAVSAKAVAQHFMNAKVNAGRINARPVTDLKLARVEANSSDVTKTAYYIFNSSKGYVIVSGDDRAREILAYGDRPLDVNNIPENMTGLLLLYKRQMEYLQANPGMVVKPMLRTKLNATSVEPLLTALWDQEAPYYNQCPTYNGSRCVTGCPATSLSMVFYYWKYPTDETPAVDGYINETGNFSIPALPPTTFDWDNMRDTYTGSYTTAQGNAVAWLMRYIGQEEMMDYSPNGSGAYGADVLRAVNFFGYDETTSQLTFKSMASDYGVDEVLIDDATWAEMLQTELVEGRPVVYCAYDYTWSGWAGHAFNVDGYDAADDTYHVNYGWSGSGNGWFALNAFYGSGYTFNLEQQMIYGIQPPATVPTIKVSPAKVEMEAYPGQTATATFTVKGILLENNITLTVNDANNAFAIDANSVSVSEMGGGKVITVTYAPQAPGTHTATITLSCPGADDKTVTLNGTSMLEVYTPVMLPANEDFINLTKFRADWTDETPAANVASYTLEVGTKPAVELIDQTDWSYLTRSTYVTDYWEDYMPEGWTFDGSSLWSEVNSISLGTGSSIISPTYNLEGYDKLTVVVETCKDYFNSALKISTSKDSYSIQCPDNFETYTAVLNCNESDAVTFTGTSYPHIRTIKIYAGDLTQAQLRANETGDATYRLIENITPDKFYTVMDLAAAGTFYFKVKALYTDGTQSKWSNTQKVVLFENGHGYEAGDANHDGSVDVSDITAIISYLLVGDEICTVCADVDGNGEVDPSDITTLIDWLLNN